MRDLDRHSVKDATYHVPSAEAPVSSCDLNLNLQFDPTLLRGLSRSCCYQWHSGQSSWPSWGQDWSSHGGWQAPSTPPRKPSKQHIEDSSQESAESNLGLPASFKPIQASAWATKPGLAGRNLEEIRLHELTWQGWSNHNLRALTQARYVSINFERRIKEATFISYLLQHLGEHKRDLDQIAESGIQVFPHQRLKTPRKLLG